VQKGEIEGRVDPNFVSISKILEGKLQHSSFRIMNFGKCISYIQYGISKLANTEQKGIPIIRMNNLKGDEWDFSDIKHIELLETEAEKYKILNGDLLFNRTNSKELVGKCGVFRYPGNWVFASYLIRVRVNESLILPNFASFFLSSTIGRLQIDCLSRQIIGMTNINAEEIKLIKIPVPPLEIQAQIVAKFEAAYAQKRAKEAEAKKLLAGIDEYLLNALGIRLPEPAEKKKFFYMRANQISGGRLDALSHQIDTFEFIKAGKFSLVKLKEITNYMQTGFAAGKQDQDLEESGIIQIRPTNIKEPERDLNFDKNVYIKLEEVQKRNSDLLRQNEVLFNNTNSQELVGKTTLFALEGNYFCSNHITRIGVNRKIEPFYLTSILNLYQHLHVFYRICVNWNNQSGVNVEMLRNIPIPLPPLAVQTEIAEYIRMIRAQVKQLEQEAKEIIERAKQEVEAMILGS